MKLIGGSRTLRPPPPPLPVILSVCGWPFEEEDYEMMYTA